MRLISIIRFLIVGILLISVIGIDGCRCMPPVIEWIKVFVDTSDNGTFEDNEEIQPDPTTSAYIINANLSFQIRIKTREALSGDDLGKSKVSIQNQPPPISIEILDVPESTYKADFTSSNFSVGEYRADIIIYSNGVLSVQSITLKI